MVCASDAVVGSVCGGVVSALLGVVRAARGGGVVVVAVVVPLLSASAPVVVVVGPRCRAMSCRQGS